MLPLFRAGARGSTKRKRSLLQIVALHQWQARAKPSGPAPALSAPAEARGVFPRGRQRPTLAACYLARRSRAALQRRRRNRRGRGLSGCLVLRARAVCPARLVAPPSAPPAPVLSASPPRGLCPLIGYGRGSVLRACGAARLRFALRSVPSLPRWPLLLVSGARRHCVPRGSGCSRAVAVGGAHPVRQYAFSRPPWGQEAARRCRVGTLSPSRLAPRRGHPAPPGRV